MSSKVQRETPGQEAGLYLRELLPIPPGASNTWSFFEKKKLGIVNREQAGKKFEPINNPVRPLLGRFWSAESEDLDRLTLYGPMCASLMGTMSQTEGNTCELHLHSTKHPRITDQWNVLSAERAGCSYCRNPPSSCWRPQTKHSRMRREDCQYRVSTVGRVPLPCLHSPGVSKD
jgi:hypothetical protein